MGFMAVASAGLMAVSSIQQGRIAQSEAEYQAALQRRNALVLEQDAKARIEKAKFDQVRQAKFGRKVLGKKIARAATSGALLSEGAPLRAISEQAEELDLENLIIGHEGLTGAARLKDQAALSRTEAEFSILRGKRARQAGIIGAGTSLLRGFAAFA